MGYQCVQECIQSHLTKVTQLDGNVCCDISFQIIMQSIIIIANCHL